MLLLVKILIFTFCVTNSCEKVFCDGTVDGTEMALRWYWVAVLLLVKLDGTFDEYHLRVHDKFVTKIFELI